MKKFPTLLSSIIYVILLFTVIQYMNEKHVQSKELLYQRNNSLDSLTMEFDSLKTNYINLNKAIDNLPLSSPLKTIIIDDKYGYRRDPFTKKRRFHSGVDLNGNSKDTVYATGIGMIKKASWNMGYGRCVVIEHKDEFQTLYAHLSKIFVVVGDSVKINDPIGRIGATGRTTGTHLHYEIIRNGKTLNPCGFLELFLNKGCK